MVTFREDNACKSKVGRNFLQSNPCKRMAAGELVHLKIVQVKCASKCPWGHGCRETGTPYNGQGIHLKQIPYTQVHAGKALRLAKRRDWYKRDDHSTPNHTAGSISSTRETMYYAGTVAFPRDGATEHGAPEAVVGVIRVVGR
ncbi:hypothetical protein R3P38DRAFT_2783079 [Favolaschia claudopus]|uniref:Uncharacterized protein n=1 Tax=Favolaschia claudopus TaxID=2862362 RepID=A0AAW0B001_9AGAR